MSDLISRKRVLKAIEKLHVYGFATLDEDKLIETINKLPSVTPKEKTGWIPVNERLPEDYQRVLVTVVNYNGDKVVRVAEYHDRKRFFQIKENHEQWEVGEKGLLAWMPLPEPYKVGDTDGNSNN